MKVKDVLAQLLPEDPEAEVVVADGLLLWPVGAVEAREAKADPLGRFWDPALAKFPAPVQRVVELRKGLTVH